MFIETNLGKGALEEALPLCDNGESIRALLERAVKVQSWRIEEMEFAFMNVLKHAFGK